MDPLQSALVTATVALAGVVGILYRRLEKTDNAQEKRLVRTEQRLDECEKDRFRLQREITDLWKKLGRHEEKPLTPPQ